MANCLFVSTPSASVVIPRLSASLVIARTIARAEQDAMADQIADRGAGFRAIGRQMIDVAITRVAEDDAAIVVEDDDPLRQVVHRLIEDRILVLWAGGGRKQPARHFGRNAAQALDDLLERRTHPPGSRTGMRYHR
jgi:hypothetical protein